MLLLIGGYLIVDSVWVYLFMLYVLIMLLLL